MAYQNCRCGRGHIHLACGKEDILNFAMAAFRITSALHPNVEQGCLVTHREGG